MTNTNTHDIFTRNAIISLLELLNAESKFNIQRNDEIIEVTVPFFYNFGKDEQFMRDFFFNLPDGCNIPLAEGNYERVPRGIVTLQSAQVIAGDMTNKFIRGNYQQEERDENDRKKIVGHSARLFNIPLSLTFSVEVRTDTLNEIFKIFEMFLNTFYANRVVHFQFRGLRIPGSFKFPDTTEINNNYVFDFNSAPDNFSSVKLTITMETYFPSFDSASDMLSKTAMSQINPAIRSTGGTSLNPPQGDWIDQTHPTG